MCQCKVEDELTTLRNKLEECNARLCQMCKLACYGMPAPKCDICKWQIKKED